jgi:hypothetical protein
VPDTTSWPLPTLWRQCTKTRGSFNVTFAVAFGFTGAKFALIERAPPTVSVQVPRCPKQAPPQSTNL